MEEENIITVRNRNLQKADEERHFRRFCGFYVYAGIILE